MSKDRVTHILEQLESWSKGYIPPSAAILMNEASKLIEEQTREIDALTQDIDALRDKIKEKNKRANKDDR